MFVKQKDNGIFLYEQRKKEEKIKGGFTMKLVSKKKKNNKGFSLVELIVVVLIIAIIAVALAPQVMKWVGTARENVDDNNIANIKSSVQIALAEFEVQGGKLEEIGNVTITFDKTEGTGNIELIIVATNNVIPGRVDKKIEELKEIIMEIFGGNYPTPSDTTKKYEIKIILKKNDSNPVILDGINVVAINK